MPTLRFIDLGMCDYEKAHKIQEEHFNRIVDAKRNKLPEAHEAGLLIFCEHPPVYTLGRNGYASNMIGDPEKLNVKVHRIGRGGDITFHGPGQIVGYPILNLEAWPMGLAQYVEKLEEAIIRTLKHYGLNGERNPKAPGVWLDCGTKNERKICALGIKASRWVTMHGWAFNVNTDLNYFNNIVPCGIPDKTVTSLEKELGRKLDFDEVKEQLKSEFKSVFEVEWEVHAIAGKA